MPIGVEACDTVPNRSESIVPLHRFCSLECSFRAVYSCVLVAASPL